MNWSPIPFKMRLSPLFTRSFLVGCILMSSCSSPSTTKQNTPPDPAADSVADGLIPTADTTIVDDDTLETNVRTPRHK